MEFSFQIIQSPQVFEDLESEWRDLLSRSDTNSIYLTWEWIFAWWQSFGGKHKLWTICVFDASTGQLMGIAPLCIQEVNKKGVKLAELTFLDNKLTSADHLDFIVDSQVKLVATYQLVHFIFNTKKRWDIIHFGSVSPDSYIVPALKELVGANRLLRFDYSQCPYILLPADFQELYQSLSKKKRKNVRRFRRVWEEHPDVVLSTVETQGELDEAVERFIQLNIARQREKGKSSTLEAQEFQNFIALVSSAFLSNGWLRMYKMVSGEEILAIDYGFQFREKFFAYSGGYQAKWSHLNPGHVMMEHSIRRAIEEGIKEYDLLRGVQSYKYDWANSDREDFVVNFPVSPKAKLIHILKMISREIKEFRVSAKKVN